MMVDVTRLRMSVIAGGAVCAVLLGGVAQAYAWRSGSHELTQITNSQFGWILLCFVVAFAWAPGAVVPGIVAGAATGLSLSVSYYAVQWLADGWVSASSQFVSSSGVAWTASATIGGALIGGLAAMAGSSADHHPARSALGLTTAALGVGLGPLALSATKSGVLDEKGAWAAIIFYGMVGLLLGFFALWRCGATAFLRGLAGGVVASALVLISLLVLEHSVLYPTF